MSEETVSRESVVKAVQALGLDPTKVVELNITLDTLYIDYYSDDNRDVLHKNLEIN